MKFAVLSLNPGIDRALYLNEPLNQGHMNRAAKTVTSQGSKGANVSIVLRRLGYDVTYYSFTGGLYGDLCERILEKEGVKSVYVKTECGIRVNTKVTDGAGVCTELNEKGGPVTEEEFDKLTQLFLQDEAEVVFMCGSFPQGVGKDAYRRLTAAEKSLGRRVVLDCDGEALVQGIQAGPDVIKPNTDELLGLMKNAGLCESFPEGCGKDLDFIAECCGKVAEKYSLDTLLCTMGPQGAICVKGGKTTFCEAAPVERVGFSGAGDTFLAGFAAARYSDGLDDDGALKFASACAGAKIVLEGTSLPDADGVRRVLALM